MIERQHLVRAGDSPQSIEKLYGTPWPQISGATANAFLRTRHGYPIHPGDRLVIPAAPASASTSRGTNAGPSTLSEFLRLIEMNVQTLMASNAQHPSKNVKVYNSPAPRALPVVTPSKAGEVKGYQKTLPKMWPKVVLTSSIESAFTVLQSGLPQGAVMTSGYRSDADQARVISGIFAEHSGPTSVSDVEQQRQWLLALTDKKGASLHMKIARVGSSPHRTGLAFDLSGASLDSIQSAVDQCARLNPEKFPLHSTIVERAQNCLHVNVKY